MSYEDPNDPLGVGKRKRGEEKEKNDEYHYYDKPKGIYRERGGCLSLYLGCGIIGGIFLLLFGALLIVSADSIERAFDEIYNELRNNPQYNNYPYDELDINFKMVAMVSFVFSAIILSSYIAAWNWKKRGVYGVVALPILQVIVYGTGSILSLIVTYAILYFLLHDKMDMFE
jgi:hypothetical protein